MKDIVLPLLMLGIGFAGGWIARFGERKGIREARFDSKTGKQIK